MSTVPVVLALTQNCQKRERKKEFACVSECVTVCVCVNLAVGVGGGVLCVSERKMHHYHTCVAEESTRA